MSHKVITTVLASALAAAGTLTLSYPAGTNPGTFARGKRHQVVTGAGDVFKAPKYFTLSYGASSITLTWGASSPTLPVGTTLYIQLDAAGSSAQRTVEAAGPALGNTAGVALKLVDWGAPLTADADGVAASQSVSAGASFNMNGALLSTIISGRMIFDVPRNVVAAWTTASVLTITGKDEYGNTMVETSASGTSHTGSKAFKEITSVASSASITSATVGTGNKLGIPVFTQSASAILGEYRNGALFSGSREKVYVQGIQTEALVDAGTSLYLAAPCAGYITKVTAVVEDTITTGGNIIPKLATVAVTGLTVVVANGATAGTVASDTPTDPFGATGLVAAGDAIEISFDSAFNASSNIAIIVEITPVAATVGTFVAGDNSNAPSGTTGDVRGTYQPALVPDGTTGWGLLLALPDPDFLGQAHYAG
jgi:hypothetical protein